MTVRPLEQISTATLMNVVKRGKYDRYAKELAEQLHLELQIRRLAERRVN